MGTGIALAQFDLFDSDRAAIRPFCRANSYADPGSYVSANAINDQQ